MPGENGSVVQLTKEEYDLKLNFLEWVIDTLWHDVADAAPVEIGGNVSEKASEFVEVYNDLVDLVKKYYTALDATVKNMRAAGDGLQGTDLGLAESMN